MIKLTENMRANGEVEIIIMMEFFNPAKSP